MAPERHKPVRWVHNSALTSLSWLLLCFLPSPAVSLHMLISGHSVGLTCLPTPLLHCTAGFLVYHGPREQIMDFFESLVSGTCRQSTFSLSMTGCSLKCGLHE